MVYVNNSQNNIPISDDNKKTQVEKHEKPEVKQETVLQKDNLNISDIPKRNNNNPENIKLFDNEKENKEPGDNPWKVKSVHMNAGYIIDNDVTHTGPMRIVNENYGTDVTITNYKQTDRKNFESLTFQKGVRFAPDEPQSNIGVNVTFENNFGIELDAKHNKIIMDGYDQNVHFQGTVNGNYVNEDAPLNTFMAQHEHTYGNMQISALGTYMVDLPAPKNHKFSFITKLGPSAVVTATHSQIKNPNGNFEGGESKVNVVGYGGMIENGLRYQFGPKTGRFGIEATHSLSYLNYADYSMLGGYTGSYSAVNSAFALKLTVGLYGNKK